MFILMLGLFFFLTQNYLLPPLWSVIDTLCNAPLQEPFLHVHVWVSSSPVHSLCTPRSQVSTFQVESLPMRGLPTRQSVPWGQGPHSPFLCSSSFWHSTRHLISTSKCLLNVTKVGEKIEQKFLNLLSTSCLHQLSGSEFSLVVSEQSLTNKRQSLDCCGGQVVALPSLLPSFSLQTWLFQLLPEPSLHLSILTLTCYPIIALSCCPYSLTLRPHTCLLKMHMERQS